MRVWDIDPRFLCRQHLLGEHREIHAIYSILSENKRGYRSHPEVKRWEGRLWALAIRHFVVCREMLRRGYNHNSVIDMSGCLDNPVQKSFVDSPGDQIRILSEKNCECPLGRKGE